MSILGLLTSTGGAIAGGVQAEEAEEEQKKFIGKTEAQRQKEKDRQEKERRRGALQKAIGAETVFKPQEALDMPKQPDLEISSAPGIATGVGHGLTGLADPLEELLKQLGQTN